MDSDDELSVFGPGPDFIQEGSSSEDSSSEEKDADNYTYTYEDEEQECSLADEEEEDEPQEEPSLELQEEEAEEEELQEELQKKLLDSLKVILGLKSKGGRRETSSKPKHVKQRRKRQASRVAELFEGVLQRASLSLNEVLEHMKEGGELLRKLELGRETQLLANAAVEAAKMPAVGLGGKQQKNKLVGVIAAAAGEGTLPVAKVASLANISVSSVEKLKRSAKDQAPAFTNQMRPARAVISKEEAAAAKVWMHQENPARSGDDRAIAWMTRNKDDFYHEVHLFICMCL